MFFAPPRPLSRRGLGVRERGLGVRERGLGARGRKMRPISPFASPARPRRRRFPQPNHRGCVPTLPAWVVADRGRGSDFLRPDRRRRKAYRPYLPQSILVGAGVWLPASPAQQVKTPGTLEMGGGAPRPGCCAHGRVPCAHECAQETRPCAQHSGHSAVPPTSGPTVRGGYSATVRDGSCREAQRRGRVGRLSAEGASGGSAPRVRRLSGKGVSAQRQG